MIFYPQNRSESMFRDCRSADSGGQARETDQNRRRQAEKAEDLGHPRPGDPLPAGHLSLARDLAGVELPPPLLGRSEEFDYPGRPGLPGEVGRSGSLGGRVHDPVG